MAAVWRKISTFTLISSHWDSFHRGDPSGRREVWEKWFNKTYVRHGMNEVSVTSSVPVVATGPLVHQMQRLWKKNDHTNARREDSIKMCLAQRTQNRSNNRSKLRQWLQHWSCHGGIVSQICCGESFCAKHLYVIWDVGDFSKVRQITGVEMLFMTFYWWPLTVHPAAGSGAVEQK